LSRYLLTCELENLSPEIRNDFWAYIDLTLGFEFWHERQEEVNQLLNKENYGHLQERI
jgi:hypothetical protein